MTLLEEYEEISLEWMEMGRVIADIQTKRKERDIVLVKKRWAHLKGRIHKFITETIDDGIRTEIKQRNQEIYGKKESAVHTTESAVEEAESQE